MRVSALAASSSGGFGLLLLEDSAVKSSESISVAAWASDIVFAFDQLNRDPEGTAVILAAVSAGTLDTWWSGNEWGSSRHDVSCSQTAEVSVRSRNVWESISRLHNAHARPWDTLMSVWVQAEEVVGHG